MLPIPFYPSRYLSHLLIVICIIISMVGFFVPGFVSMYGLHGGYWELGAYGMFMAQVLLFQFLHATPLHLLMNIYFLYSAGPTLEARMSKDRFLFFFLTSSIVTAIALLLLNPQYNTVGISGFCMALLAYLGADLYTTRHPMASQVLFMLLINVGIGLIPGISLVGHAAGAIFGILWWMIEKRKWRF